MPFLLSRRGPVEALAPDGLEIVRRPLIGERKLFQRFIGAVSIAGEFKRIDAATRHE